MLKICFFVFTEILFCLSFHWVIIVVDNGMSCKSEIHDTLVCILVFINQYTEHDLTHCVLFNPVFLSV